MYDAIELKIYRFSALHRDAEELDWSRTQVASARVRQIARHAVEYGPKQYAVLQAKTKTVKIFMSTSLSLALEACKLLSPKP